MLTENQFLDVSSEFLLGESLNALGPETPSDTQEFLSAFTDAIIELARRRSAEKLRYFQYLFDGSYDLACNKVHAFIDRHVNRALEETKANGQPEGEKTIGDSTERYVFLNKLAKEIQDPLKLRPQILNIFIPSRDNVAIAMANALFHLARNPAIWTDLRRLSLEVGDQPLSFKLLRSLTLFRHVYFETLRLQGPSPRVLRTALRDTVLPTGGGPQGKSPISVERGTVINFNSFCMHHDTDI